MTYESRFEGDEGVSQKPIFSILEEKNVSGQGKSLVIEKKQDILTTFFLYSWKLKSLDVQRRSKCVSCLQGAYGLV